MKKNFFAFFLFALSSTTSYAQLSQTNSTDYLKTINEEDLKRHLLVIAADSMEGRDTGSKGQKKAAAYIAGHFKNIGLKPALKDSYYQPYKMGKRTWKNTTTLSVGKNTYKFGTDFYAIRYPVVSPFQLKAEVVVADGDDIENLSKIDFKGKAIIFLETKLEKNKKIAAKAKAMGATAVFVVKSLKDEAFKDALSSYSYYYMAPQTGFISQKDESIFYISPAIAQAIFGNNKIEKMLTKIGVSASLPIIISAEYTEKIDLMSENVAGIIEGTDKKDEYVIITAHYDHVGMQGGQIHNGADDDGSGTVSVMEIAEAFAKAAKEGNRPRRTLVFMTVSGEEKGLFGSEYYTDFEPIFPLSKTVVNLNIDMVGRIGGDYIEKNEPNYVYLIGSDKLSSELHELSENTNKKQEKLILDYKYNSDSDPNRFYYRSDHYNFAKNDIPIIFYFNGVHDDYHKPTDDVEKIHFPKMAKIARLVFSTAWEIANREERLKVDKK